MKQRKNLLWLGIALVVVVAVIFSIAHFAKKSTNAATTTGTDKGAAAQGAGSGAGAQGATTSDKGTATGGKSGQGQTAAPAKKVDLSAYNQKEKDLTDEAEKIYQEIKSNYDKVQAGSMSLKDYKAAMLPLRDKMKANWDEYKKFTTDNTVSEQDRNSDAFKKGVQLASALRLNEYTFLIDVTYNNYTKQQIADKYKETQMDQFETQLQQYKDTTKNL